MATTTRLEVINADPLAAIQDFLGKALQDEEVAAVFVPLRMGGTVMPSLVTDPGQLKRADPLAPCFPLNAARNVAQLTRGEMEGSLVAVLRPCEIRAFVELVKLNQGSTDNLVLVGVDCHGAYSNRTFHELLRKEDADVAKLTRAVMDKVASGAAPGVNDGSDGSQPLATACRVCEWPTPERADLTIGLFGADIDKELPVFAQTPAGEGLLSRLGFSDSDVSAISASRDTAVQELLERRIAARDELFAATQEATATPDKLAEYLQDCINCYNCRVACPVCYCKECVFTTDVFDHEPWQYLGWARRKGALRMPVDTMFYHLTRLAHSSTSCVACGQCSNACPNDIPVMELFRLVGARTQKAFGYEAGRSLDEPLPLSVFQREEFAEVTGGAE